MYHATTDSFCERFMQIQNIIFHLYADDYDIQYLCYVPNNREKDTAFPS